MIKKKIKLETLFYGCWLACLGVRGAIVITLTSPLAWVSGPDKKG